MSSTNQSAETIFAEALQKSDPEQRNFYLEQACAGNAALREEVESLLQAHEGAGDFLGRSTVLLQSDIAAEHAGMRIGRYKLLEQIGEGGFGVVWMAEQEEPVRRRVALKIIKLGMDTKEVVARFEAERQALAMMDHPHIASVFDGGATDTGRPYFVMELVKGVPITEYCDLNNLSTRERLELFMQVCQAVQHAHQKGVIHRDLKPSNILVTVKDDKPVPKVIDFGVAKATQARLTQKTLFTKFRQWIGTPAYMSPEQAGLGSLDVDTRSDVYSLGVLLYELLTGRTPFDTQKLLEQGYDAVMRTIREEEPPKPSTRISSLTHEELSTIAAKRGAEPAKLGRLVRGDLDWIAMRALEKDRTRRYESASALAQDLERHLRAEPVLAAAPDFFYRTGKFVRRNRSRLAFAALACVIVALAAAVGTFVIRPNEKPILVSGTNTVFSLAQSDNAKELARSLDANPDLVNERDKDGATPLIYAAGAGATNTLLLLIASDAALDAINKLGRTALCEAAMFNQTEAALILIGVGADPNPADVSGARPLNYAAIFGSVRIGRALLEKGARTEVFSSDRLTPLGQAAALGHAGFVDLLLSYHANVDARDANGNTPLHLAALGENKNPVSNLKTRLQDLATLKEANADLVKMAWSYLSNQIAVLEGSQAAGSLLRGREFGRVAEALWSNGAALEATNKEHCTPLLIAAVSTNLSVAEVLVAHKANLNAQARDGSTPLNFAAMYGSAPATELLLKAGANFNLQDGAGFTPLNTAIERGYPKVAELLLEYRASPSLATPNGQTPLHTAAWLGDLESMRLLLDREPPINAIQVSGTPLAWAVQYHQVEAVKLLLQRGASRDVATRNGMTPLHWAATLGYPDVVEILVKEGARVDADSSWQGTPLNAAASGRAGAVGWLATAIELFPAGSKIRRPVLGSDADYLSVVQALLAAKPNVNAHEPHDGRTPIFAAVMYGQLAIVEALLAASADLKAQDRAGQTPLHVASHIEASAEVVSNIVSRLIDAGADVAARDQFLGTPLHAAANAGKPVMVALLLEANPSRLNDVGPNLCTPLQLAVMRGRRDVVELLLSRKPNLDWRSSYGTTALHLAIQLQAKDLATLLVEHGADVDAATTGLTNSGITALMLSAEAAHLDLMKLLLDHSAQIELTDRRGMTALNFASAAGQVEAAKLLLEKHASLKPDLPGNTPALIAAKAGRLDMLKFLLDREASSISNRDYDGFTLLHGAADHGHADVVEYLVGRLDVNSRSKDQSTPLHRAANGCFSSDETQYVAVIKVLVDHEAKVNATDLDGHTALHCAAGWGRPKIMAALLAAKANPSARDRDGKTALDIAMDTGDPRLHPDWAARRKECSELLLKVASGRRPSDSTANDKP
jgi:ankyrin repeat protein/serine/threonine protein kinase